MEPIDYGGALRRSWRLLIVLGIVGAIIAVLVPASSHKKAKSALSYSAVAVVGSAPNGPKSPLDGAVSNLQIAFVANQVTTLQTVASQAGLSVPDSELPGYLRATVVPANQVGGGAVIKHDTPTVVDLTANSSTYGGAVQLANMYASVTEYEVDAAATVAQAGNPKSAASQGGTAYTGVEVVQQASGASHGKAGKASLTASRKVRGLVGLVIGVLIGAAAVLLRELLDKRLRNAARAEANFGFPVIAEIPSAAVGPAVAVPGLAPMVDVIRDPDSAGAEAYRMLRMSVMFEGLASLSGPTDPYALGFDAVGFTGSRNGANHVEQAAESGHDEVGDRRVVLVVSAGDEPSRPYVAANLAAIYAEAGERVVVISTGEVDTRSNGDGASVNGSIRPEDVQAKLEPSRLEHVSRLSLKPFVTTSGQLVSRMPAIFEAVRPLTDVVIVEVPPILAVHHAEALVRCVDVVLVVAECRFTTFNHARRGGDLLRRMGAPVLGIVLTGTRLDRSDIQPRALGTAPEVDDEHAGGGPQTAAIGAGVGASARAGTDPQV